MASELSSQIGISRSVEIFLKKKNEMVFYQIDGTKIKYGYKKFRCKKRVKKRGECEKKQKNCILNNWLSII